MSTPEKHGLTAYIYRGPLGDFSNKGLSSRFERVTVMDTEVGGPFPPREDAPAVRLVRRTIGGKPYVHAVPAEIPAGVHSMFGGSFIFTSDSRLRRVCDYPIPLHDRVESSDGGGS